jgi:hypothetical protein
MNYRVGYTALVTESYCAKLDVHSQSEERSKFVVQCNPDARPDPTKSTLRTDLRSFSSTSRSQLDRVLDPSNVSVQLDTLIKAARALGKEIEIKIKRAAKKEAA